MKSKFIIALLLIFLQFAKAQESKSLLLIGCNAGLERTINYFPKSYNEYFEPTSFFTFGLCEAWHIGTFELFIGQSLIHESVEGEIQGRLPYGGAYSDFFKFTSQHFICPIGLNIRLSKKSTNYIFATGGYRLDFVFNQTQTNVSTNNKTTISKFLLSRQNLFAGIGYKMAIAKDLELEYRLNNIFPPFKFGNLQTNNLSDLRLEILFSVYKEF